MTVLRSLRNVGGFLSDYYLGTVFGRAARGRHGSLATRETDVAFRALRRAWDRSEGIGSDPAELREAFVRPLLGDAFGYYMGSGTHGIYPLYASAQVEADRGPALLLAYVGSRGEDLDGSRKGQPSAALRVTESLSREPLSLRYGLLVNGDVIRLVRRLGDGPRGAFIELDLEECVDSEDSESFAAAWRLFSVGSFTAATNGTLPIEDIERESREHALRVSDDLKAAVFRAAEDLTHALIEDLRSREPGDPETGRPLANELIGLRDAALTCLYRLLFILYAEARDEHLLLHPLYRDSYSLDSLIREVLPSAELAENRYGMWARLQALFAIHLRGLGAHSGLSSLPARGGDLFDAATPAGRRLVEARLSDATVGRLLISLTTTAPRRGVGRERVSFRELDIEQLGAVYEGLLEYEPAIANTTTFEVRVQGRVFVLADHDISRLCEIKRLELAGDPTILEGTEAADLHVKATGKPDETDSDGADEAEVALEDDQDDEDDGEASIDSGGTARLVRRIDAGRFHFVPGGARKGSGSFYTPVPLVRDLVHHALGPRVRGLRADEIESLRVLDPACGSAHFLVEAMRFLGRELHRAYVTEFRGSPPEHFRASGGQGWDGDHQASDEQARASGSEARAWCKRRIAERCLFGVDLNPTAVELARVALWIESLAGDRPLSYFEHHIRCGNSLLGTWLDRLGEPPVPDMKPRPRPGELGLFSDHARAAIEEASKIRALISRVGELGAVEADTLDELRLKEHQRQQAAEVLGAARLVFDLRSASAHVHGIWADWLSICTFASDRDGLEAYGRSRPWWLAFENVRERERFFHWELEFPEVLFGGRSGFDAVLGNPPWDKVLPTKHEFYARYDVLIRAFKGNELDRRIRELQREIPDLPGRFKEYQVRTTTTADLLRKSGDFPLSRARSQAAHEDVSKYFLDRAARLCGENGAVGFVVPSVIYNGDAAVGLRRYLLTSCAVERFYGFENRRKIFPIDSRYKFVNIVFRKGSHGDGFDAAFMRHDVAELLTDEPKPWTVHVGSDEVERLSPETFAFLEYRSPQDQEIVRKMYEGRATLANDGVGSWGARFISWRAHEGIFNAAEDKDLWTDPASKQLFHPLTVLGRQPRDHEELLVLMRAAGFWPVFEGKNVEQHLVGTKPIRWWLSVDLAETKYNVGLTDSPLLVFRDTASNTNERSCIATVLPPRSCGSHTLSGIRMEHVQPEAAATVLNSLCFDFALRLRTAGTHLSFTYIRPMPVPPPTVVNSLPRIGTRAAWTLNASNVTELESLWPSLWEANRAVAIAYGLGATDVEHILNSFPVLAKKRPAYAAYLRSRLVEWRQEGARA